MKTIKLLALSGSLRKASHNTAVITALKILAPCNVTPHDLALQDLTTHSLTPYNIDITIGSIGDLPLFNPDRESENIPALITLKLLLQSADGLIIATPEYAHGITGPMKNALDWLVSGIEMPFKPIMLINTSPRSSHALLALKEVLTTMSAHIIAEAFTPIQLLGSELDAKGITENPEMAEILTRGLQEFCGAIEALKSNT